jgi:Nickel responsive protein SCO4226-like
VAEFLVELYVSRGSTPSVDAGTLTRMGTAVRYLRSILVPEDETCFLLFEAASVDDVREAARIAGLPIERISEAVTSPEPTIVTDA